MFRKQIKILGIILVSLLIISTPTLVWADHELSPQSAGVVLAEETKPEKSDVDQEIENRTNSTSDTLRMAAIAAMIIAIGILLVVLLTLRNRG